MHQLQHIGIHYGAKHLGIGGLFGQCADADARCGDNDIGCADGVEEPGCRRLHGGGIANIGTEGAGIEAVRNSGKRVSFSANQAKLRALRAVVSCQRRAKPGTGAGDENPEGTGQRTELISCRGARRAPWR